jgi:hypothetical protein
MFEGKTVSTLREMGALYPKISIKQLSWTGRNKRPNSSDKKEHRHYNYQFETVMPGNHCLHLRPLHHRLHS